MLITYRKFFLQLKWILSQYKFTISTLANTHVHSKISSFNWNLGNKSQWKVRFSTIFEVKIANDGLMIDKQVIGKGEVNKQTKNSIRAFSLDN